MDGVLTFVVGLEAELAGILQDVANPSAQVPGSGKKQQAAARAAGLQVPEGQKKEKSTPADAQ
eukprot:561456-Amphidinium_carterae.1